MPISKAVKGEWPPVTDLEGGEVIFEGMKCPTLLREKNWLRKGAFEAFFSFVLI